MTEKIWATLHHNGVFFQPPYEQLPSHIKLLYNKKKIPLTIEQEEAATFYAKYVGSEYVQNSLFNRNFWNDFKKILKNSEYSDFKLFDFTLIHN